MQNNKITENLEVRDNIDQSIMSNFLFLKLKLSVACCIIKNHNTKCLIVMSILPNKQIFYYFTN